MLKVKGIHHISAIVKHPQENIDFYAGVLGLAFIKKAVNFDDAHTYHFYLGNHRADVGTAITFFPWNHAAREGIVGDGQLGVTTYAIPRGSFKFWEDRLKQFNIPYFINKRFGEKYLSFKDMHQIENELVESDLGTINEWSFNGVSSEVAIKGFYSGTIYSNQPEKTKDFLINVLGLSIKEDSALYTRFEMDAEIGKYIDLANTSQGLGKMGSGTVHHIAFSIDESEADAWMTWLIEKGFNPSGIKNRDFFKSIYFREPGGTIIELASITPGFNDGKIDHFAQELYLPEHFEHKRAELEEKFTPVFVREIDKLENYKYQNKEEYDAWFAHKELLRKINELARIAKERELTNDESNQRDELRKAYVQTVTYGVRNMVNSLKVQNETGTYKTLEKKKGTAKV